MKKKAVAYLRISREDETLENQRYVIDKWAEENGYEVVMYFPDPEISGEVDPFKRPAFKQMIEYARKKGINTIIFEDISRFSRKFEYGKRAYLQLTKEGFNLIFIKDPRLSINIDAIVEKINESLEKINDPTIKPFVKAIREMIVKNLETIGDLFIDIGLAMAEAYLQDVRQKTKRALARLKDEGRLYHKPSLADYYAAWLYNKDFRELTKEERETAKAQLKAIIRKYWNNPAIKKRRIPELLVNGELREMYQRFPKAPRSFLAIYRLMKEGNPT